MSSWNLAQDPITGHTFYFDEEGKRAKWSKSKSARRLSVKGRQLFNNGSKGVAFSFDMTQNAAADPDYSESLKDFVPARGQGLDVAKHQLRCGMKDPLHFTDVDLRLNQGGRVFRKPRQVFCYSCGRQFGTRSLKIHWKSCVEKRANEMKKRPKHLQRPLSKPPDETMFPFPTQRCPDTVFQRYNMEALNIYGNYHGVFICWKCKMQFRDRDAFDAHLRSHDGGNEAAMRRKREAQERARRDLERENRLREEAERQRRLRAAAEEETERQRRLRPLRIFITNERGVRVGEAKCTPSTTITSLKRLCGISNSRKLSSKGRSFGDDEEITLFDLKIEDGDEIHLLPIALRARLNGMRDACVVPVAGDDSMLRVKRSIFRTVTELELLDVSGRNPASLELVQSPGGPALRNTDTVSSLQLRDGDTLIERSTSSAPPPPPPPPPPPRVTTTSHEKLRARNEHIRAQRQKNLRLRYGEGHRAADQALVGKELRDQDRLFRTRRLRRKSIRRAGERMRQRVEEGDELHHRQWFNSNG